VLTLYGNNVSQEQFLKNVQIAYHELHTASGDPVRLCYIDCIR
jgi:hypothetical protein